MPVREVVDHFGTTVNEGDYCGFVYNYKLVFGQVVGRTPIGTLFVDVIVTSDDPVGETTLRLTPRYHKTMFVLDEQMKAKLVLAKLKYHNSSYKRLLHV